MADLGQDEWDDYAPAERDGWILRRRYYGRQHYMQMRIEVVSADPKKPGASYLTMSHHALARRMEKSGSCLADIMESELSSFVEGLELEIANAG